MKLIYRTSFSQLQRGFQLMEMIIVLTAMVGLMGMFSKHLQRELQQTANQAVAHQLRQVTRAAYQYAQDNYLSLSNPSPSITLKKLLDEGYLGKQLPEKNLYDQSYHIEVTENDPAVNPDIKIKSLQILVTTTGGRTIDEDSIRAIASKVGGDGGYSSITRPGRVIGSSGCWEVNVPGIKDGHLASLTVVNEKDVMANYYVSNGEEDLLHRVKVDGHPEYNRMETGIDFVSDNQYTKNKTASLTNSYITFEDKNKSISGSILSDDELKISSLNPSTASTGGGSIDFITSSITADAVKINDGLHDSNLNLGVNNILMNSKASPTSDRRLKTIITPRIVKLIDENNFGMMELNANWLKLGYNE